MIKIIGLSGKIGVGKNYIADRMSQMIREKSLIVGFADHLKVEVAMKYNGIHIEDCLQSNKQDVLRAVLQLEGTENGRYKYGKDIWIKRLENWIRIHKLQSRVDVIIIPDCRFKNEAEWIEKMGGILIKVEGPRRNGYFGDEHISENSLNDYKFKYVLDNYGNQNLGREIREILTGFNVITY